MISLLEIKYGNTFSQHRSGQRKNLFGNPMPEGSFLQLLRGQGAVPSIR